MARGVTRKTDALERLANIDITTQTGVALYELHLASVMVTLDELKQVLSNTVLKSDSSK